MLDWPAFGEVIPLKRHTRRNSVPKALPTDGIGLQQGISNQEDLTGQLIPGDLAGLNGVSNPPEINLSANRCARGKLPELTGE